ncbi:hypothetical protein [Prauserella cavernicola]|uniref:Uncharacterized protein n=1 Tax=Prauserella cavernicola TaxID=2800127 RepID=A0A934QWW4_9PSEU|nr:hypothetical protein [Prauserella cavernicola]MBK1787652.1 hypothetical protein [Prauserella cavernicola]
MSSVVWIALAAAAGVLLLSFLFDLRARRRGHRFRDSGSMWRDVREVRRDTRAGKTGGWFRKDIGWTHNSRRDDGDHRGFR